MQPHQYLVPPVPVDAADAQRWQESRRRRRLLEGMWGVDLEQRIRLHFGIVRRMILGPKSKSRNLYRRLVTELSVLYRTPPKVTNRYGGADALLGPDGMLARSGLWPQMRSVQTFALGVREEAVRVEFDPINGRPAYRQVHADNMVGRSRALDPGVPVEIRELRWYELPGVGGRWAWDILSIEDPDRPYYRIEEVRGDGRDGEDLTRLVLGREVSGDAYPYRWTQGPRRGMPFLPYVLYHADISSQLWDPYAWIELADAALDVAAAWTWWGHLLFKASWPQRYGIDVYVEGMIPEETDGGLRTEMPADASSLIHLRTRSGAVNPQVGQWQPSADILNTAQAIGLFERGCSDIAGIDAAHIVRESSDAWSGAALSISRDGKREAQALYQPQFEPRDVELMEKSAALVNLSETLAAPLPEEGYRILYAPIGLAYQELESRRKHHTELITQGRMSLTEAYQEEHPGLTLEEARRALVDARVEALRIESEAKAQAQAEGLIPAGVEAEGEDEGEGEQEEVEELEGGACPIATQDIKVNLANRQKAIDVANYGPANPNEPGDYWQGKAKRMRSTVEQVRTMVCGNCAFFMVGPKIKACIAKGIGEGAGETIAAGELGYCEAFDFKCAAKRTCDAWVVGGPVRGDAAGQEAASEGEQESEDSDEPTGEVDVAEMAADMLDDGDIEGAKRMLRRGYAVSSSD